MSIHTEICPVCKGAGVIEIPPDNYGTSTQPKIQTCYGCEGKGWIVVQDDTLFELKMGDYNERK